MNSKEPNKYIYKEKMKAAAQLKRRNAYSEISSSLQNSTLAVPEQPTSSWCSSRVPKQVALTIREPRPVVQKAARPQLSVSTSDNNKEKGKDLCTSYVINETGSVSNTSNQALQIQNTIPTKDTRKTKRVYLATTNQRSEYLALKKASSCQYCNAKKFEYEPLGFCCSNGSIRLTSYKMPTELSNLYFGKAEESKNFRTYIRTYNNMFAFTSLGVKYDKELAKRNSGVYTFKVQGKMYHFIDDLIPSNDKPKNLQLYFYDHDNELPNRMACSNKIDQSIVQKLMDILKVNPYSIFLRSLFNVSDLSDFYIALKCDSTLDQRTHNLPTASEIAAIWVEQDSAHPISTPHIRIYTHSNRAQLVNYYYGCYDPLQYPLLFPFGENGWHCGIKRIFRTNNMTRNKAHCEHEQLPSISNMCSIDGFLDMEAQSLQKGKRKRDAISCREYYCYKFQIREDETNQVVHCGRIFQQFIVDIYIKVETQRLDFFSFNQDLCRIEVLQGILDILRCGEREASNIGKKNFLPVTFIGGPRDMRRRYMDAIALVQYFGKPDLFITMTCNPSWPEIKEQLLLNDEVQNRPDLVSRVFRAKVEELKKDILKRQIFGKVAAFMYTIEFQKRGLPHAHFLIILANEHKLLTPESYDKFVCAELPDSVVDHNLYSFVIKHMMHGPCGKLNPINSCMKQKGKCKFKYPKDFAERTSKGKNSYPIYKRRKTKECVKKKGIFLDNSWVVPYNPFVLCKYNCHMNVEVCSDIKVVKYIYKYICKGHDKITFQIHDSNIDTGVDEIKEYQSGRWVSPPEAAWRLFKFPISEMTPSVYHLQLHLQGQQFVSFKSIDKVDTILNNPMIGKTMLTEFFAMNRTNTYAMQLSLLYKEFPEYFVWSTKDKMWTRRKQRSVIGRVVTCHPTEGERYYLRLLLMNVRGPKSYEDLLKVDVEYCSTFRESAEKRGLLHCDNNLVECMSEAVTYQMPYSLRRLFATLLVYCNPANPAEIWKQFEAPMSEDFQILPNMNRKNITYLTLNHINEFLHLMGHDINEYKLIAETVKSSTDVKEATECLFERNIIIAEEDLLLQTKLNTQQRIAYDTILDRIFSNKSGAFFIDGPGGTGKTFLYRALLAAVRSRGFVALATASSGVAASILPGGRTAHSRFKFPIEIDENFSCNISKQSSLAALIRDAKLIVWDEVSMAKKGLLEAFDILLRDLMDTNILFGGKVVVFGGDFRQTLPVVRSGKKDDFIRESLLFSEIWNQLEKLQLSDNMRAKTDPTFCEYLLRIGNGNETVHDNDKIQIPHCFIIPFISENESLDVLFRLTYPDLHTCSSNVSSMTSRVILTTKNDFVDQMNDLLITQFPGDPKTYVSFDETIEANDQSQYEDFLHTLHPASLPPHKLTLKKYCPVMLLRNLNLCEGLCNGTSLICNDLRKHVISATIATGDFKNNHVFIPRIPLLSSADEKLPVPFKRTQYPLRLCFAMTINKAQGQTLDFVGVYLREPIFSHGQLYVALSRARSSNCIKILIRPPTPDDDDDHSTYNIVYNEIIQKAFT